MFQWDKSIKALDVVTSNVVHLFRSMREVQLALPGLPAQEASAYLCQYKQDGGIRTAAVFHLHKSRLLAFYFSEPRTVPESKIDSLLDQGLNFVESMGFLLTDQDIHLLDAADQEMLWLSLPLWKGLETDEAESPPKPKTEPKTEPKIEAKISPFSASTVDPPLEKPVSRKEPDVDVVIPSVSETVADLGPVPEIEPSAKSDQPDATLSQVPAENVDDLLAAVESMRAKRPGLRARKLPPSKEELDRRRQQLRENIGRILVSL